MATLSQMKAELVSKGAEKLPLPKVGAEALKLSRRQRRSAAWLERKKAKSARRTAAFQERQTIRDNRASQWGSRLERVTQPSVDQAVSRIEEAGNAAANKLRSESGRAARRIGVGVGVGAAAGTAGALGTDRAVRSLRDSRRKES